MKDTDKVQITEIAKVKIAPISFLLFAINIILNVAKVFSNNFEIKIIIYIIFLLCIFLYIKYKT